MSIMKSLSRIARRLLIVLLALLPTMFVNMPVALAVTPGVELMPPSEETTFVPPTDGFAYASVTATWRDVESNTSSASVSCSGFVAPDGVSIVTSDDCANDKVVGLVLLGRHMIYTGRPYGGPMKFAKADGPSGMPNDYPSPTEQAESTPTMPGQNQPMVIDPQVEIMTQVGNQPSKRAHVIDSQSGLTLLRIEHDNDDPASGIPLSMLSQLTSGMAIAVPVRPELEGNTFPGTTGRNSMTTHIGHISGDRITQSGIAVLTFDGAYPTTGTPVLDPKDNSVLAVVINANGQVTEGSNSSNAAVSIDKIKQLMVRNGVIKSDAQIAQEKDAAVKDKAAGDFAKDTGDQLKALKDNSVPMWFFTAVTLILGAIALAALIFALIARDNARNAWGELTALRSQRQPVQGGFGPNDQT